MPLDSSARNLSITIITFNEELNLPRCLESLPAGAEIIVLDSGSNDNTVSIARAAGAHVTTRAFTNFADQHNAAIDLATRPWVFSIDADEVMDEPLRNQISCISEQMPSAQMPAAYRVRRGLHFMGKRLRFGKTTDWPVRLFPRRQSRFVGEIHEEVQVPNGQVTRMASGLLLHYSYRDLTDYFARFNRYTTMIAAKHHAAGDSPHGPRHWLRPWSEFFTRYIIRLGFLDGYAGYTYALVSSLYAFVKYAKIRDIKTGSR